MKYLQLFEATRHPWTGRERLFYILWSDDGKILQHGEGHPSFKGNEGVVRLRPTLKIKIRDFERTVESASLLE